jgi:hypothetical protein
MMTDNYRQICGLPHATVRYIQYCTAKAKINFWAVIIGKSFGADNFGRDTEDFGVPGNIQYAQYHGSCQDLPSLPGQSGHGGLLNVVVLANQL